MEKKTYVKPTNANEAVEALKGVSTEFYSRIKGRGLGLIEKWFAGEEKKNELQTARESFLLLLSSVSNSLSRKIEDCTEILAKKK